MRFISFVATLVGVATVASAFQDFDTGNHGDLANRDATKRFARDVPWVGSSSLRSRGSPPKNTKSGKGPQSNPPQSGKSAQGKPQTKTSKSQGKSQAKSKYKPFSQGACPSIQGKNIARGDPAQVGYEEDTNTFLVLMGGELPATDVDAGARVAVTDVSGCSGLFFWSQTGAAPSAFHLTAGREKSQAKEAVNVAIAAGTTYYAFIEAPDSHKAEEIEKAVRKKLPSIPINQHIYNLNTRDRYERWRFDVSPGSMSVVASRYSCR
ncbi:hypothetical protein MMYC01_200298 [Madurella mycetomatis]|uniref:Uncharacterized protein n=1 Tax=Madurella mycetomatis TaxID=100816 RepID=A0A175WJY7_9PEZI|nr:hypothetical protein MMYC01_200298 [Madurella mycetomatis]